MCEWTSQGAELTIQSTFRRILLSLLILCLAAPALALPVAGHDHMAMSAPARGGGHHPAPDSRTSKAKHECIGCIAPVAAIAAPIRPFVFIEKRSRPASDYRTPDATDGPETPPPQF